MKIAMMVRGYIPVPGPSDIVYAPLELAALIAEGLVRRGHQVDFYGPRGTKLKSGIKTLGLRPLATTQKEFEGLIYNPDLLSHYKLGLWDNYLAYDMFEQAKKGEYDLLHFDHPEIALPLTKTYPQVPVVYTLHDPIYEWYQEIFKMYAGPSQHFISISNNQRKAAPNLPYLATVHHGIDANLHRMSKKVDDYLLFAGRINDEKGVKEAVEVALATKQRLLIIGPLYPDKKAYFDKFVEPYLGDEIQYLGYIKQEDLWRYYQKAKAFLAPLQWEEPFGLTMIEALAAGTPVIAMKRGSASEIIVDGKTGYLVDNVTEMIKAVKKIDKISRSACREHVKKNFSIDKMVDGYEEAFKKILKQP